MNRKYVDGRYPLCSIDAQYRLFAAPLARHAEWLNERFGQQIAQQ